MNYITSITFSALLPQMSMRLNYENELLTINVFGISTIFVSTRNRFNKKLCFFYINCDIVPVTPDTKGGIL